jgi:hypothetical protein
MRDVAASILTAHALTVAGTIEHARQNFEIAQQQQVELRLAIMQTRIRIAEVKATLRRFETYLEAGRM